LSVDSPTRPQEFILRNIVRETIKLTLYIICLTRLQEQDQRSTAWTTAIPQLLRAGTLSAD